MLRARPVPGRRAGSHHPRAPAQLEARRDRRARPAGGCNRRVVLALTSADETALASVPPGVAVVDARNRRLVAHIPTTEIATPAEAVTGDGAFWVWNLRPFSLVQVDP